MPLDQPARCGVGFGGFEVAQAGVRITAWIIRKVVERRDYFSAAIDILGEVEHGGLKMAPLCRRLDVTTGSFYHYFKSWAGFKTALLEFWLDERTVLLADAARRYDDAEQAVAVLVDFACELPHRAEASIRAWSHSDQEVRRIQAAVDEQRYRVTFEMVLRLVDDPLEAHSLARLGMFVLTGYQQTQPLPDIEDLRRSLYLVLTELISSRATLRTKPPRP